MRAHLMLFMVLSFLYPALGAAQQVYKYVDQNGAVAFTDNIENVPEAQRPQTQTIDSAPLPTITPEVSTRVQYDRWIDHPLSKYIIGFIALSIVMLFVQHKTDRFLLKMVMKLLFVGFLGAAIYSVLVMQGNPITPAALQKAAEPYLPTPAPINAAKEAVSKMEEAQKKQKTEIDSLIRSVDNPNQ